MAKHYKYVNGKKMVVINNYDLGADVIPEEMELIPDITAADAGKVLTADSNGEPVWDDVPEELPSLAGNGGKVLKVNSGATGVEWAAESTELPSLTDNAGKVLTVNSGATGVEWAAPSGGGGSDVLVCHITNIVSDAYGYSATLDKTNSEIFTALNSGKLLVIIDPIETQMAFYLYLFDLSTEWDESVILYAMPQYAQNDTSPYEIIINQIYKIQYYGSGETGVSGSWALENLRAGHSPVT